MDHFQDVRLISFCRCNLVWNVGDVAYIRPRNSEQSVKKLFAIFDEHQLSIRPSECVALTQIDDGELDPKSLILLSFTKTKKKFQSAASVASYTSAL